MEGFVSNKTKRIASYHDFWLFYVSQHLNTTNRWLHFFGTTCVLACVLLAAVVTWELVALGLVFLLFSFLWGNTRGWKHLVGLCCVVIGFVFLMFASWQFTVGALFSGYGFAWVGHMFFEKNRPATFTYPLWSLFGDFQMYWYMWRGKMGAVVEKIKAQQDS